MQPSLTRVTFMYIFAGYFKGGQDEKYLCTSMEQAKETSLIISSVLIATKSQRLTIVFSTSFCRTEQPMKVEIVVDPSKPLPLSQRVSAAPSTAKAAKAG